MPAEDTERNIRTAAASHSEKKKEEKGIPRHPEEMPLRCRTAIFPGTQYAAEYRQHLDISGSDHLPRNKGKEKEKEPEIFLPRSE